MLRTACLYSMAAMHVEVMVAWAGLHGMNGHFTCVHAEDAARVFDKAAVRIRYDKARLNFQFEDYVDDQGQILPDQQVGTGSAHFHQPCIHARKLLQAISPCKALACSLVCYRGFRRSSGGSERTGCCHI